MRDGKAAADEGAAGWVIRFTGPFAGEGIRRGFLKVFQYCCSGVRRVEGSAGNLTCWRGRTGAAMAARASLCFQLDRRNWSKGIVV